MQIVEFKVKRIVITKGELKASGEWENFASHFRLVEYDMYNCPDEEEFILDPLDAMLFEIITAEESASLEEFYDNQLKGEHGK